MPIIWINLPEIFPHCKATEIPVIPYIFDVIKWTVNLSHKLLSQYTLQRQVIWLQKQIAKDIREGVKKLGIKKKIASLEGNVTVT